VIMCVLISVCVCVGVCVGVCVRVGVVCMCGCVCKWEKLFATFSEVLRNPHAFKDL
jgi:hypothetical protein